MLSRKTESDMRIGSVSNSLLMLIAGGTVSLMLTAAPACAAPCAQTDLVEFEKMTWVEVKCEIAAGKTSVFIDTAAAEIRTLSLHDGRPTSVGTVTDAIALTS